MQGFLLYLASLKYVSSNYMIMNKFIAGTLLLLLFNGLGLASQTDETALWHKYEIRFTSDKEYANPIYDINTFTVVFTWLRS